jgi:hypothetical protein
MMPGRFKCGGADLGGVEFRAKERLRGGVSVCRVLSSGRKVVK